MYKRHLTLVDLGWDGNWREVLRLQLETFCDTNRVSNQHVSVGRVWQVHKNKICLYAAVVELAIGERPAVVAVREIYKFAGDRPVVGDWVIFVDCEDEKGVQIYKTLPRRTALKRGHARNSAKCQSAGEAKEQLYVANIDAVVLVHSLLAKFSLAKVERFAIIAAEAGVPFCVFFSHLDMTDGKRAFEHQKCVQGFAAFSGAYSCFDKKTLKCAVEGLRKAVPAIGTVALVGDSGGGKTTLINTLIAQEGEVRGERRIVLSVNSMEIDLNAQMYKSNLVRKDGTGRHTTTVRTLVSTHGMCIVDNPGVRSVGISAGQKAVDAVFGSIAAASKNCAFYNCTHSHEPECGVLAAIEEKEIDYNTLTRWRKIVNESGARLQE